MPDYRAYIVGKDGHFKASEVVRADNDENAVLMAKKLVDGYDIELWELDRKVALLPHKDTCFLIAGDQPNADATCISYRRRRLRQTLHPQSGPDGIGRFISAAVGLAAAPTPSRFVLEGRPRSAS